MPILKNESNKTPFFSNISKTRYSDYVNLFCSLLFVYTQQLYQYCNLRTGEQFHQILRIKSRCLLNRFFRLRFGYRFLLWHLFFCFQRFLFHNLYFFCSGSVFGFFLGFPRFLLSGSRTSSVTSGFSKRNLSISPDKTISISSRGSSYHYGHHRIPPPDDSFHKNLSKKLCIHDMAVIQNMRVKISNHLCLGIIRISLPKMELSLKPDGLRCR